jgi:hypothetical protein
MGQDGRTTVLIREFHDRTQGSSRRMGGGSSTRRATRVRQFVAGRGAARSDPAQAA